MVQGVSYGKRIPLVFIARECAYSMVYSLELPLKVLLLWNMFANAELANRADRQ
jgi:hypothetical protein